MADPKVSDLEQIKKASIELGLSAEQAQKFVDSLAKSSRDVVEATKSQYEQLIKNKNLIQETYDLSELQYSSNIRISEEARKSLDQRKDILNNILERDKEILKIDTDIQILQKKKQDLGKAFSKEDEERLKNLLQQKQLAQQKKQIDEQDLDLLHEELQVLEKHEQLHKRIIGDLKGQFASLLGMSDVWSDIQEKQSISGALFAKFAANAGQLLKTVNQGNAEFARTTGQIADRTVMFGYGLSQFGLGFKELNKASADLYVSMSDFSNLNKETQLGLAESSAKMELLGVSSQTTGQILNDLTKGLRMTANEAKDTNEYLARAAMGMGIPPQKMASEFAAAAPKIAAYGKQGVDVFVNLEKQAKSLGIQMNTLMGIIGDTFDTFEGGARAAGRLNAVLGGDYLNSVEMLNATEDERLMILKRSFDMSGKNWESMSKAEKQAVANAAGIKDLNEASKIFGSSTADLTEDMQKQAVSQEELAKVQREAVEVSQKMEQVFNSLLIAVRPIVEIIATLVNWFTMLNDKIFGLPALALAVGAAFVFFGITIASLIAPIVTAAGSMGLLGASSTAVGTAGPVAAGGITAIGTAIAAVLTEIGIALAVLGDPLALLGAAALAAVILTIAIAITSVGVAAVGIGYGMKLAAEGAAELAKAFGGLGDAAWPAVAAIVGLSLAFGFVMLLMVGIAPIATIAAPGLFIIAVAAIALGAALYIVSSSMSIFVDSLIQLIDAVKGLASVSTAFTTVIDSLEKFINLIEDLSSLPSDLSEITDSINALSEALNNIPDDKTITLNVLGEALQSIYTSIPPDKTFNINGIVQLSDAMEEIPENKTLVLKALNETLNIARTITEEEVKPTKDFLNTAKEFYIAQEKTGVIVAATGMVLAAIKEVAGAVRGGYPAGDSTTPVKIVLNDGQVLTGKAYGSQNLSKKIIGEG